MYGRFMRSPTTWLDVSGSLLVVVGLGYTLASKDRLGLVVAGVGVGVLFLSAQWRRNQDDDQPR